MTAQSAIHPKCRPWKTQALPIIPKPYIAAIVMTIQCRAEVEVIEGAAISSTPPQIQPMVPICQHSRIRLRNRGGSMVARANTLVSPRTPWIRATAMAASPEHCNNRSRIGAALHTQLYGNLCCSLASVNTVVYGRLPQDVSWP